MLSQLLAQIFHLIRVAHSFLAAGHQGMHLHPCLVNTFKNAINLLFTHIDIVLRTHNQLKAHVCQLLHIPYRQAQGCLQKAMGLIKFALRQKLGAPHHPDDLRLAAHKLHSVLTIAQHQILQHIGQNSRITARRHKGCITSKLCCRYRRKNALIGAQAGGLAQLLGGSAVDFALFGKTLQGSIKQHQGVDACPLKITQHLVLGQSLQNCQLAQTLVFHS